MACKVAAVGEGTHAVLAPALGWLIFDSIIWAISSGIAHIPLPIWDLPRIPVSRPISTFQFSYASIHRANLISPFGRKGPASMEVWISSPVRSKNPVLMKTTRSLAIRTHSFRLRVVRLSSSIIPNFRVFFGRPIAASTRANNSQVNSTSWGPCILGLTI